jgi:tetratricopeptide (TPR) repeat protein
MNKFVFPAIFSALIVVVTLVYANHFNNSFHFDDDHTIITNLNIRQLGNIPTFFKDGSTMSSLPSNQDYRPGLTTLNAIDFYLSGNKVPPQPFAFHVSIFISYLLLGTLLFFFLRTILDISLPGAINKWIALFATGWFWLHTANADTINYIIARSDSFSTLSIILSFVVYQRSPSARKYYLYLLPMIIGFFVKEPAIMFVPLLFFYKLLFEQTSDGAVGFRAGSAGKVAGSVLVPFIIAAILYTFSRHMAPKTWVMGGYDRWKYLFTQPFVIFHYFCNFFVPVNLVVDTDWTLVPSYTDDRVYAGLLFIIIMLAIAYRCSKNIQYRPVAFGIVWFFIALIPTSSVFPFAEVLNDHRAFFPYIGLFIACATIIRNLLVAHPAWLQGSKKTMVAMAMCLLLALHAYGTYQRNIVWHTEKSLWKEATVKAPGNARAWMNYGNTQMSKGNFAEAQKCFETALKLAPNYQYIYINLGILKSATGDASAENYFRKAIELNSNNPESYVFYGDYLLKTGRTAEAKMVIEQGLTISPAHEKLNQLLQACNAVNTNTQTPATSTDNRKIATPATAEDYLNLSLSYYNEGKFQECINAAYQSLAVKPDYDLAYNNICAAYNQLHNWDSAIVAGKKGLQLNPDNPRIQANLNASYNGKAGK